MAESLLTIYLGLSADTRHFLRVIGWLAPEPVPASLLATFPHPEIPKQHTDPTPAVNELESAGHLTWNEDRTTFTIQPGLPAAARFDLPPNENPPASLLLALRWVNRAMPTDTNDVRTWPIAVPLLPHAITVATAGADHNIPEPSARLLNQAGLLESNHANFAKAEPLYRQALALTEKLLGETHPTVAAAINNLAQLLKDTNRLAEAEPLMRRSLAIGEQNYGPSHPTVATRLNNLAQLLQDTNRLAEAEPLMRRALAIDEESYGDSHSNVALDLNNLAQLLQATNRLADAEPFMRRALAIDEQSYGPSHPYVARDLNNLAQLLQATNRLAEAEPLMVRALAIWKENLGDSHPNVASALNNLAQLLQATNRLAEAEPLMRRALAIDEQSYGPSHPDVAIRLNNLALLLQDTNRLAEAEPLMRRHLEIFVDFTVHTGHPHPHLQGAIGNYAGLLLQMGDTETRIREKIGKLVERIGSI